MQLLILAAILGIFSLLNIVAPISGSAIVTPILTAMFGVKQAIAIATVFFFISNIPRIYLFREHILWHEVKLILPASIVGAFAGSLLLVKIPEQLVLVLVFLVFLYFYIRKIRNSTTRKNKKDTLGVGLLSGSLQGAGLPGSDIRNGYFYARGLSIAQIHGTSAIVGSTTMLLASLVRGTTGELTLQMALPVLATFPIIVLATYVGRHIHFKLSKQVQNRIVIGVMTFSLLLLALEVIKTFI